MANELAKTDPQSIASIFGGSADLSQRPDFIPAGDKTGTEGITKDDIRMPRLVFAQGLSAQLTPGDSQYIENLKMFDMFNDATREVYGKGPLYFIVCKRDVRGIEFRPRSEGGGVIDLNVPLTKRGGKYLDARLEWQDSQPPRATRFDEFVCLLLRNTQGATEEIVISIKNTNPFNRRAAQTLNGFIRFYASQEDKSVPIYGVIYSIESKKETNDKGTFATPSIKPIGFLPTNDVGRELFDRARDHAATLEGKTIEVYREGGDEEPVEGHVVDDNDKIPF
jgi:hypothetical protein